MDNNRIYIMAFPSVYPHYLNKIKKKGKVQKPFIIGSRLDSL